MAPKVVCSQCREQGRGDSPDWADRVVISNTDRPRGMAPEVPAPCHLCTSNDIEDEVVDVYVGFSCVGDAQDVLAECDQNVAIR
jgi:hypothetical protein